MSEGSLSLSESASLSESLSLSESVSLGTNDTSEEIVASCPAFPETYLPLNFSGHGCRQFLERAGLIPAHRLPGPRIDPMKYKAHEIPMTPPLPGAEGVEYLTGFPPPDRGQTYHWPHPQTEPPAD